MFSRKCVQHLFDWSMSTSRRIAVVTGPRCVGKTTLVKEVGRVYGSFIEIDMKECMWLRGIIAKCSCTADLAKKLDSAFGEDTVVPGDTLLLLDEIEYCHEAAWHLERLSDRECMDIVVIVSCISSGTSGFRQQPRDWEHRIEVRPFDFTEFLHAMSIGEGFTESIKERIVENGEICLEEDEAMNVLFRRYMVTGGMPAAVATMAATRRIADTLDVSRSILNEQMHDAFVFVRKMHDIVAQCVRSLPEQLAVNGRFTYSKVGVRRSAGSRQCYSSVEWLVDSGIVTMCDRVGLPMDDLPEPVPAYYKLYIDPGALASMLDGWVCDAMMNGHYDSCPCAVVENCVAGSLRSSGYDAHYYCSGRKEADFVVRYGKDVVGLVVRSHNNTRRKSAASLLDAGLITKAVEFTQDPGTGQGEKLPIYAAGFPEAVLKRVCRAGRRLPGGLFTAR